MPFKEKLELLMVKKKLKQVQIAQIAGVSAASVSEWMSEGSVPKSKNIAKLANYFNVSVQWLVDGEDKTGLSPDERELLEAYRLLNDDDKKYAIRTIKGLSAEYPAEPAALESSASDIANDKSKHQPA